MRYVLIAVVVALAGAGYAGGVPSGTYVLDKGHGYVSFTYSHLGFSNPHVGFRSVEATLRYDAAKPQNSRVLVKIDPASIDSRVERFDDHLKGADFFDVANHSAIEFETTSVTMTSKTSADIVGALTIKGIAKPVVLKATLNKAGKHPMRSTPALGFDAETTIARSEWDLGKYAPGVSDEVRVFISMEMHPEPLE